MFNFQFSNSHCYNYYLKLHVKETRENYSIFLLYIYTLATSTTRRLCSSFFVVYSVKVLLPSQLNSAFSTRVFFFAVLIYVVKLNCTSKQINPNGKF